MVDYVVGLGSEADQQRWTLRAFRQSRKNVGILGERERRHLPAAVLLDLLRMGIGGAPVGDRGDHDRRIGDRKSVVQGKSVSVRVDLGGRRIIKKKKANTTKVHTSDWIKTNAKHEA